MSAAPLAIVDTGSANLASVVAAFRRLGVEPVISSHAEVLRRAQRVVLPGVGAFGAVSARLTATGADDALRERFADARPVLAICLGMQLLGQASEESPGVPGLGVLRASASRFAPDVCSPQLGWNEVAATASGALVQSGYAYFANSFAIRTAIDGWTMAWSEHGVRFAAAIEQGPHLACQFHPELSGSWGASLLSRWYAAC